MTTWEKVGKVAPRDLSRARLELHWAAQLPGAVGNALVAHRDDDSHEALKCVDERSLLVGRATDTPTPLRVALSLSDLRVVVIDQELGELASLTLQGKTLEEGFTWLARELEQRGGLDNPPALAVPDYDMPDHELATGGRFQFAQASAFEELASWFRNASRVLDKLEGTTLCWPHHFDIAVLDSIDDQKNVGTGLSPGDGSYDEPYWFVSPSPRPEGELPALEKGHWHREGFLAAILTGTDIVSDGGTEQGPFVDTFIDNATKIARKLLS